MKLLQLEIATQGKIRIVTTCALYAYYTLWVIATVSVCRGVSLGAPWYATANPAPHRPILQPFVDKDQPVLRLFPDPYYAIALPVFAGVVLFSATLVTLGAFLLGDELAK